jgi:hypothetical protein
VRSETPVPLANVVNGRTVVDCARIVVVEHAKRITTNEQNDDLIFFFFLFCFVFFLGLKKKLRSEKEGRRALLSF